MRPSASHKILSLTRTLNVTTITPDVGLWNKLMIQAVNLKLKVTKNHSQTLLLSKLRQRNIGTNEIEHYVKKIKTEHLKSKIRGSILKHKISDAKATEQRNRRQFLNKMNYLNRRWGHNNFIMGRFKDIMQQEVELEWNKQKNKKYSENFTSFE